MSPETWSFQMCVENPRLSACHPRSGERGQASVLLILILGTFMLGALAFAVDLSGLWFDRQSAQSAADAACLAGAADMYALAGGMVPPSPGFTVGTAGDCSASPGASICKYAAFNGYSGTGLNSTAESNSVAWTFPASMAGAAAPAGVTYPFLQVTVIQNIKTLFMGLLGAHYQQVAAVAACGTTAIRSPTPLLVLNPSQSAVLTLSGNGAIDIAGGPERSIQVNSTSLTAVQGAGNSVVDTTQAGPNGTGGDVGIVGGPAQKPVWPRGTWNLGTGSWVNPTLAVPDPYAAVPAPTQPAAAPLPSLLSGPSPPTPGHGVPQGTDGCFATAGCDEYFPGYYSASRPIKVTSNDSAIFMPGIYYMDADVTFSANSTVRNGFNGTTSPLDGVMFYFHTGKLSQTSNSGAVGGMNTLPSSTLQCDPSNPSPPGVPANLGGSILWSQCVANGTYYDPLNPTDTESSAGTRGILMFQAHTNDANPTLEGNGQLLFTGAFYFHAADYGITWNLGGNGGTTPSIVGYFVVDKLAIAGNGALKMDLNSSPASNALKIALLK